MSRAAKSRSRYLPGNQCHGCSGSNRSCLARSHVRLLQQRTTLVSHTPDNSLAQDRSYQLPKHALYKGVACCLLHSSFLLAHIHILLQSHFAHALLRTRLDRLTHHSFIQIISHSQKMFTLAFQLTHTVARVPCVSFWTHFTYLFFPSLNSRHCC